MTRLGFEGDILRLGSESRSVFFAAVAWRFDNYYVS